MTATGRAESLATMSISDRRYNRAKAILSQAGSNTAAASHNKHTQGKGSPDGHGRNLIAEARAEFMAADVGQANLQNGMTAAHDRAISDAESELNI